MWSTGGKHCSTFWNVTTSTQACLRLLKIYSSFLGQPKLLPLAWPLPPPRVFPTSVAGALLPVPGTWCLAFVFCFVFKSRVYHTPHTLCNYSKWDHSLALSLFIPLPPHTLSLPFQQPFQCVHVYSCKMSVVFLWTYIFKLHKWECSLSPLFFPFPSGLKFKAPFMLPWCTSNWLRLAAAYCITPGIPHVSPVHFSNDRH